MSFAPPNPLVWCEIPVTDLSNAVDFYSKVFGYEMSVDNSGPNPIAFLPAADFDAGVAGHIYEGKPPAKGTGPTLHLAVPDTVEETAERFRAAGGEVHDMVVEIPPGRFSYGTDPDGNSIGLFQGTS